MKRRTFLQALASIPLFPFALLPGMTAAIRPRTFAVAGQPGWPSESEWSALKDQLGDRLLSIGNPAEKYAKQADQLAKNLENPYFIGDSGVFTQTSGWIDAWDCAPSVYAVAAESANDVSAAVNFARKHNVRLVVRGGAHSYKGQSNAKDSLMIWTRRMNGIELHDSFVPQGAPASEAGKPAVTVGAGNMWIDVYERVVAQAGRYVQGGGCATVGVAGFLQGGGFGSFSKHYGLAAAALLEAEVVTADGAIKVVNKFQHPDLFWALKGGSGASMAVITKLTLATRDLPETNGAVRGSIQAKSDAAFKELIDKFIEFYKTDLFNEHWGESVWLRKNNVLDITVVCWALGATQAANVWKPFFDYVRSNPEKFSMAAEPSIIEMPARSWWSIAYRKEHFPNSVIMDTRQDAKPNHAWWHGDGEQAGAYLYGYESIWLPQTLLSDPKCSELTKVMFDATRHYDVSLQFNKGLAGAPKDALEAAADTAMNPAVIDAFALVIIAGGEPHAYAMLGEHPHADVARQNAKEIKSAIAQFRTLVPDGAAYSLESGYQQPNWQTAFWGKNYARLKEVKAKYDPTNLFNIHHGIGSGLA